MSEKLVIDGEELIGSARMARTLGITPTTLKTWAAAGRVPAYRAGQRGHWRFAPAKVRAALESETHSIEEWLA